MRGIDSGIKSSIEFGGQLSLKENDNFDNDLKRMGLKKTKSRKAVIDILMKSNEPIGAEQIYYNLIKNNTEINLSTVYRTLEALESKGLVTKVSLMDTDRMLFEYNKSEHRHYLVCICCKKILTVHGCPLITYEKELEKETNFKIAGHKLYLYGYCSECQKNNKLKNYDYHI